MVSCALEFCPVRPPTAQPHGSGASIVICDLCCKNVPESILGSQGTNNSVMCEQILPFIRITTLRRERILFRSNLVLLLISVNRQCSSDSQFSVAMYSVPLLCSGDFLLQRMSSIAYDSCSQQMYFGRRSSNRFQCTCMCCVEHCNILCN